jgi:molybdate transport system substrate-binding protein
MLRKWLTSHIIATAARSISLVLFIAGGTAHAAEIKLLCAVALQSAISELAPQFEQVSGHKLVIQYGTAGAVTARIEKGENADVAISARQQITNLEKAGKLAEGTTTDVAKFGVGIFVRKGAAKPDISSVESFKRTLLAAKSLAHADPARGGVTAIYVAGLLGRLDIAADIKQKTSVFPPGVYESVAKGDVEIGFGGTSEILADPSVDFVGPLPPAIQNYTVFAAGIVAGSKQQAAGKALIQFISSPAASAVMKAKGFEPL